MSSGGTRKAVLFVCTVTFTLSTLRTCGSITARTLTVSDGFKTYRPSVSRLQGGVEGEDSGKDVRFGWLALGRNFQPKYRSYSGVNVNGLRGSSWGPSNSLLNITHSEIWNPQDNSKRINKPSKFAKDSHLARKNDIISGDETRSEGEPKPAIRSRFDEENSLKLSRNTKWIHDSDAVEPRMESLIPDSDYQSDSPQQAVLVGHWHVPGEVNGLPTAPVSQAAESRPFILCGSNSMTLTANGNEYAHLKVDLANGPPLSLSQLPSSCRHTLKMTPQNVVFKTPYDGCFIMKKDDKYILPLLWWESPVTISCPATATPALTHPSVLCSPFGMTLKIEGGLDVAKKLHVLLQDKWVPFLSAQCSYRVHGIPGDLIMHIPYNACGMTNKGGLHFLPLLSGNTGKVFAYAMNATLASADPFTIEIKGLDNVWMPISSAPPQCYGLEALGVKGVKLSSSLPPCHAHTFSPSMVSLPVKFLDIDLGRYRILELQCPYYSPTATSMSPTTPEGQTAPPKPRAFCLQTSISVELLPGVEWALRVQDVKGTGMSGAPSHCVHSVSKGEHGQNILTVPFNSCHVSVQGNERRIVVKFRTLNGQEGEVPLSCIINPPSRRQGCEVSNDLHLPCGSGHDGPVECGALGCCYYTHSHTCYYPVDECTADRHIVFTVPASLTEPPLSTASLFTPGNSTCVPQKVTPSFALFKIPLDGCGVHKYEIGATKIYMVEVLNTLYAISLNFGTITRDSPVRLLVECRYSPSSLVSVAYLVKTPSLGPSIQAQGVFGVQLRIAKDEFYTSYHPQYHRPLSLLLGQPLHLEVRLLNPPDAKVLLLVHYCLAYPRSGQTAWVLLYDGCPNQLDVSPHHPPPSAPSPLSQTRRFTFSTFQFLSPETASYSDQEIYFMCSTEICSPSEGPCIEGCIGSPSSAG
ncbi:hypothetical protein AAFF_G00208170 [Aldrovandia affinis]|uniref:Uncharacterized protein n=1 Tax=Aldrovandia affinis TaxID=143900 RepID=A0AAD7RHE8_9TELE|nr:hypothetical protein AAFF_G00208170 [Aldrovandia affinis]